MPIRPFRGVQTLPGTTPQPIFGVATTAASVLRPDPYTQNTKPGSNESLSTFTATNTGFKAKDSVIVGPAAGPFEAGTIESLISTTGMVIRGLTKVHASGDFVILNEEATFVKITPITVAATMYVGTDHTTGVASTATVDALILPASVQPRQYIDLASHSGHPYPTGQYWIQGSANDVFVASFAQG